MTEEDENTYDADLRALAQAHGVASSYEAFDGSIQQVATATLASVLTSMDVLTDTHLQVKAGLRAADEAPWRRTLPPSVVLQEGQSRTVNVHVPHGRSVEVWIELEDGGRRPATQLDHWVSPRQIDDETIGRATFEVPDDLPLGWHELVAATEGKRALSRCRLVVAPARLEPHGLREEYGDRAFGLMAQLYSVRSARSWGIGDFADLAELTSMCGHLGADFLLINPLHAAEPVSPLTPSPYLPSSRLFLNPIYIRPEDIRECAYLPSSQRTLMDWGIEELQSHNTSSSPIDRDAVWAEKKSALETIFAAPRSPARERAFTTFRARGGRALENFALWCAAIENNDGDASVLDAAEATSGELSKLREELRERITFHCWMQWIADEQLDRAARVGAQAGMSMGIMTDLAVGVHPAGADAWAMRDILAPGISVGAPADMYNQQGQHWSQPPWRPDELAQAGYEPLRAVVRAAVAHAGAIRIDHIMGLFRLWWIPEGTPASGGTYVHYDHEAMVSVVLLEAHRAGAMVIGEDLGTVEPWVREYLDSRGVYGTSVLWFEKDEGRPLAPADYREDVLATVTTHDLPPTAGYLGLEHVELRSRLSLLSEPVQKVRLEAQIEHDRMMQALKDESLVAHDATERQIVQGLHRYLARTPSHLVGIALTDAVGERRAQNQPGTDTEYPNWKMPLADGSEQVVLAEDLLSNARLESLVVAVQEEMLTQARKRYGRSGVNKRRGKQN